MVEQWLDPRVSKRMQQDFHLSSPPANMSELTDLLRREYMGHPRNKEFMELVRGGKAVIAETDEEHGYSVVLPEGRETKVECAGDAILTSLLRRTDLIRAGCPHCGEQMEIKIEGGRVVRASSPSIVYWVGGGPETGIVMLEGKNIPKDPICNHIHLFPNRDHLAAWLQTMQDEFGLTWSLDDAVEYLATL